MRNIGTGTDPPWMQGSQDALLGLNIYGSLKKGGAAGDVAAGLSAAKLGANLGAFGDSSGTAGTIAGEGMNALGIVSGIERGGVPGYAGAAINAAELGAKEGLFGAASGEVGAVANDMLIPLSVYEFAKNWQSGNTGSDAISGAESGAAIGSVIPGVGSLIGMGVGAAVGAISSLFGPGRKDPETIGWDQYAGAYKSGGAAGVAGASPAENFQMLAGIFDARGSNIPFYKAFGRMGENQFMDAMAQKINQASQRGQITSKDTPETIYSKVVQPWITAMGGSQGWQDTYTVNGSPEKAAIGNLLTSIIGQYTSGQMNAGSQVGIKGQTIAGLPGYAGPPIGMAAAPNMHALTAGQPQIPSSTSPDPTASMLPALLAAGAGGAAMQGPRQYQMNTGMDSIGATPTDPTGLQQPPGNDPTGGGGNGWSPLATTAALEGLGLLGAGYAQSQNNKAISPITQAGAPFVGAGNVLLGEAMNGQLTPQQAQVSSTLQNQGKALISASTPAGSIAQQDFAAYQSGQLKPGDQAALDQQVASQIAQLKQTLGPNVDSTQLATYEDQIRQNAMITKQSMLNSYFATGNQAFDTWMTGTQAGQQAIVAGQEYAVQSIDNTFQKALSASSLGSQNILAGIELQLKSNTQLASAFGTYSSNLAKAYALMQAAKAGVGGGGGGGSSDLGLTSGQQQSMTTDLNNSVASDLKAGTGGIGLTFNESMANQMASYQTPAPSGSVEVGQPTDVMGQVAPSFADAAQSAIPQYTGY